MIDTVRYVIAVMLIVAMPISIGLWFFIHPFARAWRRIGPWGTYAVLAIPAAAAGTWLWINRAVLVGRDLGTQPLLVVPAIGAYVLAVRIARERRRQLTMRVLSGVPELSRDSGTLLTEGIYARIRNPRYVELLLFVLGYAAIANFVGTWVLLALSVVAIHLIVLLEERELRDRFGLAYDEYCRRVPRYVPRRRPAGRSGAPD